MDLASVARHYSVPNPRRVASSAVRPTETARGSGGRGERRKASLFSPARSSVFRLTRGVTPWVLHGRAHLPPMVLRDVDLAGWGLLVGDLLQFDEFIVFHWRPARHHESKQPVG